MSLPLGPVGPDNPLVGLDIAIGGVDIGRIVVELKADVVPLTSRNFLSFVCGEHGKGYAGSIIHRVLQGFMCQGGDIESGNGTTNAAAGGGFLDDENFALGHWGAGVLAMANNGKRHTNGCQFYFTFARADHLDRKNVVVGQVVDGYDVLQQVEYTDVRSLHGQPVAEVSITGCEVLAWGAFDPIGAPEPPGPPPPPPVAAEEEEAVEPAATEPPAPESAVPEPAVPEPAAVKTSGGGVGARISALLKENPDNICLNTFDLEYYNSLGDLKPAFLRCLASGIENPDSGMGCYACQPEDYDRFKPFFSKALAKYHKVAEDAKHVNDWSLDGVEGLPEGGVLDISQLGLPELSMRVRVGRNLKAFPLPGAMSQEDRCNLENRMIEAFEVLFKDPAYGGKYCSFTPGHPNFVDEEEYQKLVDAHIAFKDMSADSYLLSAGIAQHWPYGRGVYISEDKGFIIWVGEEDHLRIMCMKKGTILNEVFDRLKAALDVVNSIESIGGFAMSEDYGVVTSCPTNLGTGMRASLHIALPNLTADGTDAKAKAIAKPLGLSVRGLGGEHTPIGADGTVDISPSARFCITEAQIITALYHGIKQLKAGEDEANA
jgi:cyclophilin family peptidyl-prolyl cis-trans isomerase/protein-arginine kinase